MYALGSKTQRFVYRGICKRNSEKNIKSDMKLSKREGKENGVIISNPLGSNGPTYFRTI